MWQNRFAWRRMDGWMSSAAAVVDLLILRHQGFGNLIYLLTHFPHFILVLSVGTRYNKIMLGNMDTRTYAINKNTVDFTGWTHLYKRGLGPEASFVP